VLSPKSESIDKALQALMDLVPILPGELLYDAGIITRDLRACHPNTQLVTPLSAKGPVHLFVEIVARSAPAAIRGFEIHQRVHHGIGQTLPASSSLTHLFA
jgi:hypothetical protein